MKRLTYHVLSIILIIGIALTFDACNKEEDKPSGSDDLSIPETTKVIEKELWSENFISVDTSNYQFTFKDDINNTLDIKPGDIIVSQEGYGYLRKVTKVEGEGNNIKVYTSFANLTDAIENGGFSFTQILSEQKIKRINYVREGVTLNTSNIKNTENTALNYQLDTYLDNDEKVHLTGEFIMLPELSCDYEISGFTVDLLQVEFTVEEGIEINADITLLDISWEKEVELAQVTFHPIIVMVGPVPVVIVPELEIMAGANLEVHSNVVTNVDQDLNYVAGILYENQEWSVYNEITKELNYLPPTLSASAEAKAYIKPQLNLKIYGIVSPYLQGELYGRIVADIDATPWWSVYGGVEVGVGVEVEILGAEIFDYYTDPPLIEYEELVAEAQSGNDEIFTDPRDGQEYKIVTIGDQTWFAENLNYETGTSWCYDNDPANCQIYGRLYDWETAKNACPNGWHLPSDTEWNTLEGTVDSQYPVGDPVWNEIGWRGFDVCKRLKSKEGWSENGSGTDAVEFNALPNGFRDKNADFAKIETRGYFWASTEDGSDNVWSRALYHDLDQVIRAATESENGFSVRCIKDE